VWKTKLNTDGAKDAFQGPNKKLCLCQKLSPTKEDDNTDAVSVGRYLGCKEEDLQLNQFTKSDIRIFNFLRKICLYIIIIWCNFLKRHDRKTSKL